MTVVVKKDTTRAEFLKLLAELPKKPKFDAHRFVGALSIGEPPLKIQRRLRDEWK